MVDQPSISGVTGTLFNTFSLLFKTGGLIVISLILLAIAAWWFVQRRRWNLKVELKFPRAEGGFLMPEWGKGRYNASKGYCIIKRPGMGGKKYEIKNFDPKVYIQGTNTITVVQTGPETFMPILPTSFFEVVDENGKIANVLEIKGDTTKHYSWAINRKMQLIDAYTITSFLRENGQWISLGFIIAIVLISQYFGIGFVIDKLPK